MAKLILHTGNNIDLVNERRLRENFYMTHSERMQKAFELMKLSLLFKNGEIKKPDAKGILLKR